MKKEFWIEKWQQNQTGFHKDFTHPLLIEFIGRLNINKGDTVFVPLCGKTVDMLWLNAQGYRVIGIELSQIAVEQFFSENKIVYELSKNDLFNVYTHENITIYQGDFFDLTTNYMANVKAVYDRAALIALPDVLVEKYVDRMKEIIPANCLELLITLEFKKTSEPIGPPFTTSNDKVNQLFADYRCVKTLQEVDIIDREPKFKGQGCDYVWERVYLVSI